LRSGFLFSNIRQASKEEEKGGMCGTRETDVKCRENFSRKIESGKALGKFGRKMGK